PAGPAAAELTDGDHRGQLPPIRCQPLPARTGQADGLIRLSGRIPAGGDTQSIIMSPGQHPKPPGPRQGWPPLAPPPAATADHPAERPPARTADTISRTPGLPAPRRLA